MVKCSFCGNQIAKGTGMMYVLKEGKIFYFCSSKCKKNQLKLKEHLQISSGQRSTKNDRTYARTSKT